MAFSFPRVAVALGLLVSAQAHALSCDDITGMLGVNVPSNIVVQTMERSGQRFTPADVTCLRSRGAPAEVISAAERLGGAQAAPVPAPAPMPAPVGAGPVPAPMPAPGPAPATFDGEEMVGGDLSDDGEPQEAAGPAEVEAAIEFYRTKKYLSSSKALYDLLVANKYPDQETKITYYLAKSLYELGMLHSAQYYFFEVVKKGTSNPYFKYALPRMVAIAEHTGNDIELIRIVSKLPPEAFPRRAQNHLNYLMGRRLFDEGELTGASNYFRQVSAKSELYMRSKYFEGVINVEQGKMRSAVQAFREVMQAEPPLTGDIRHAQELEDLKDLALINVARIYYELERFDQADTYYGMVDRESTYWPQSLFERAWGRFLNNDLNNALGLLLTVQSPYFTDTQFLPDVTVLKALSFFNLCEYDEVERILIDFENRMKPLKGELSVFLDRYRGDGVQLSDQAFDAYFGPSKARSALNQAMFARALRNRDLASLVRHLDMMDAEVTAIDEQKGVWKTTVGDGLKQIVEKDRQRYKQRAGVLLLQELQKQLDDIDSLLVQSEIIRFEVVDAQRADYEFKMQNPDVGSEDERKVDFATSKDIIYWPFNGEFWRDELGYYRYAVHTSCK